MTDSVPRSSWIEYCNRYDEDLSRRCGAALIILIDIYIRLYLTSTCGAHIDERKDKSIFVRIYLLVLGKRRYSTIK